MLWAVPFAFATTMCLALLTPLASRRADLFVSRVALSIFGDHVAEDDTRRREQRAKMRAAHAGGTHRVYASRTLLYCAVLGVAGSILGIYVAAGFLAAMEISGGAIERTLPTTLGFLADLTRIAEVSAFELFALLAFFSATVGSLLAFGIYYARWELLNQRAIARAGEIEATLPRTVAFVYALSRSGMAFPQVMNTLATNEEVYGEAATELSIAVREMNTFGTDVLTALQRTAQRTPSDNMEEFAENLASVLGSGRSLSDFLHAQYERYQQDAESQQQQYLELLSTFAEAYVTVLVAGPLFFITILVVVGLVIEDTLPILRIVVYAAIPLGSVGFVLYVDSVTRSFRSAGTADEEELDERTEFTLPDGGAVGRNWRTSRERLVEYDRYRRVLDWLGSPARTILRNPGATFLITVPLGAAWVVATADPIGSTVDPVGVLAAIDGAVVEAAVVALLGYTVVYETRKRRIEAIEAAVPDFLDRLASINEAGMTVVESFKRVADSDLDELTRELERTRRDIQWGADVETALKRLDGRVQSTVISRSVALITNAIRASGDVAPVLRIAADETRAARRLRRERKQLMVTYLIVIYIAFLVFVGIIAALTVAFLPAIEQAELGRETGEMAGRVTGGITDGLGDTNVEAYELLLFHAAALQAVCSGFVAGQLGEGEIHDGAKHCVALLVFAYVSFVAMGII